MSWCASAAAHMHAHARPCVRVYVHALTRSCCVRPYMHSCPVIHECVCVCARARWSCAWLLAPRTAGCVCCCSLAHCGCASHGPLCACVFARQIHARICVYVSCVLCHLPLAGGAALWRSSVPLRFAPACITSPLRSLFMLWWTANKAGRPAS